MLKKWYFLFALFMIFPFSVKAEDNDFELIDEVTKYYKTVKIISNNSLYGLDSSNYLFYETFEISKEEYDLANIDADLSPNSSMTVNTEYKEMTTSILTNGNYYRYKNVLSWKKMPSTRSYDIIGIGFYQTVKVHGTPYFSQYSCTTSGNCTTTTTNYLQYFNTGVGTSFLLPSGNLSVLKQTLYFDVDKNTNSTIVSQKAYGDYSHAQSSVSLSDSKKYSVSGLGISLDSSISSHYDDINKATASWSGVW